MHIIDDEKECRKQQKTIKNFIKDNYVDNYESAIYYDALPRFDSNVYDYLYGKEIGMKKDSVIAEIGSGTGRIVYDLLLRGSTVYAVDPDLNMRKVCEKKCAKFNNNYISVNGLDSNFNLNDKSIDFIISSQSFHRFDKKLFLEECKRVLKIEGKIVVIWYRIDFKNNIYKDLLLNLKNNYEDYETRYNCDEIDGSIIEEKENIDDINSFFSSAIKFKEIYSYSNLTYDEFEKLCLSFALFPLSHKINNVNTVLDSDTFDKNNYKKGIEIIFKKYSNNNVISLPFRVQIFSDKCKNLIDS